MKTYYYGCAFDKSYNTYLIRKYHEVDWEFTGRIKYLFEAKDIEPEIKFEIKTIDNSWPARWFPYFFGPITQWKSELILFEESDTETYEPFVPKEVIVECEE